MGLLDFLKQTNHDRTKYRPAMGKMLNDDNKELDITKILESGFDFDALRFKTLVSSITEIALGNVPGYSKGFILDENPDMEADVSETMWDQGGLLVRLSGDTQLKISSTSALDVGIVIAVLGTDSNYNAITRVGTLNGNSQVNLDGLMFRVNQAVVVGSVDVQGDIYIAEADTVVGGVPQTSSKIKSKIRLGNNITSNGFFTVPLGKSICGIRANYIAGKGADVRFSTFVKLFGGVFFNTGTFPVYQGGLPLNAEDVCLPEKTELEVRGTTDNPDTFGTVLISYIMVDN